MNWFPYQQTHFLGTWPGDNSVVQPVSYNISLNTCSITNDLLENGLKAQHHFVILNNWLFTNGQYFPITTSGHLLCPR